MAASTVCPSMVGNSASVISHTMPAYEPALCPRMCSEPPAYPASLSALSERVLGSLQIPTNGCAEISLIYDMQLAEAGGSWIYSEMQLFCSCKMHLLSLFLLGSFQNAHV